MSSHTKTPWRWDSDMVLAEHDGHTDHVADCPSRRDSDRFANAAFIVRACNSHEALVEALRETMTGFERCMRSVKIDQEFIDIKLQKAKAALAKVTP